MKISCLPVSLFSEICSGKMDLVEWAKAAKEIGYDGFDISVMFVKNRTQTYLSKLKKDLQEVRLPIIMMTSYPDFTHPDARQRERELQYLKADLALCSELGVRYLRVLAGQDRPENRDEDCVEWVSEAFHEIDAYAKGSGVQLVFENHGKPGAWDRVDFTYDTKRFIKILERIRDTDIRINFDTGNITAHGEDPMEYLPQVFDLIETIHLTDMREKGVFSPTVIGTGVTPNARVFRYLKEHGFDKWICIEEASGHGLDGIRDVHAYTKQLWEKA